MIRNLNHRSLLVLLLITLPALSAGALSAQTLPPGFSITDVSGRLGSNASAFAVLPDQRILIGNQTTGMIQLVVDGSLQETAIFTVPNIHWSGEQGLLGLAIDPDFPDSAYVYVFHTRDDSLNRVSRYTLEGDLTDPASIGLTIDSTSQRTVIEFRDRQRFHNGGTLRFGSDKTLYISHGEDNFRELAQDLTTPNGAILRINRDGSIPDDNPVFDTESDSVMPGLFAKGLRNPFRFAIDPMTHELFIGDVGPEDIEELNIARGGENFGWPRYLSEDLYLPEVPISTADSTFPIFSYFHSDGMRSVIALLTYRQRDFPNDASFPDEYEGVHFFGDFFAGPLRYLKLNAAGEWEVAEFAQGISRPVDAAPAQDGGVYVLEYGKAVRKITYDGTSVSSESDQPVPDGFALTRNYPNPFRSETRFSYRLVEPTATTVAIYNVLGEHVVTLRSGTQSRGLHEVRWDRRDGLGRKVPPGAYVYRVDTGTRSESRLMVAQ